MNLNILIVEDDISLAIDLQMLVEEIGYQVIGRADNSTDAFEIIFSKQPDVILMDIDIKGQLTGIEIAEKIRHLDIPVLFVTSFNDEQHYNKAMKTNQIGYLVKPIRKFTLQSTIENTFREIANTPAQEDKKEDDAFPFKDALFYKKRGLLHKIIIADILYIKSDGDYTLTYTKDDEFLSSVRLFEFEEMLQSFPFAKTHRSYLVNLSKITALQPTKNVLFIGEKEIPISRGNKQVLLDKITYLK